MRRPAEEFARQLGRYRVRLVEIALLAEQRRHESLIAVEKQRADEGPENERVGMTEETTVNHTRDVFTSPHDGTRLSTYRWGSELTEPRGVVQIAHGLAEHAARYDRLAAALVGAGYRVDAADHHGHGRSISEGGTPGSFGPAGFDAVVEDLAAFGDQVTAEANGLPVFLVAHSMGSFAAQHVIIERPDLYRGVVLSGSSALAELASGLAQVEGPVGLEAFNAGFEHRTGYEWLSRDEAEVDKYMADPLSGFDLPDETVPAIFVRADRLADPDSLAQVRPDLSILVASGQSDPLSADGPTRPTPRPALSRRRGHRRDRDYVPRGAPRDLQRDQPRRDHRRRDQLAARANLRHDAAG